MFKIKSPSIIKKTSKLIHNLSFNRKICYKQYNGHHHWLNNKSKSKIQKIADTYCKHTKTNHNATIKKFPQSQSQSQSQSKPIENDQIKKNYFGLFIKSSVGAIFIFSSYKLFAENNPEKTVKIIDNVEKSLVVLKNNLVNPETTNKLIQDLPKYIKSIPEKVDNIYKYSNDWIINSLPIHYNDLKNIVTQIYDENFETINKYFKSSSTDSNKIEEIMNNTVFNNEEPPEHQNDNQDITVDTDDDDEDRNSLRKIAYNISG